MKIDSVYAKNQKIIYQRLMFAVWVIISFYTFFFAYHEAWLGSITLAIGAFLVTPFCWYLEEKGYGKGSRILFSTACTNYVFLSSLGLQFTADGEYYYSCAAIVTFLIFDVDNRKEITLLIVYSLTMWTVGKVLPLELIPDLFFIKDANLELLTNTNHYGSFLLTVTFMAVFIETIKSLKFNLIKKNSETKQMADLIMRTEEIAKIGSWSLDFATNQLQWSDETYRIHEVKIGSPLNIETAINYYHPDDRERITKCVENGIANGTPWDDEFRFITAKNNNLWVRAAGRVITNDQGEVIGLEGSFQDITSQKKAEFAKDEFLAVISHEMRTPLMSVIGMTDVLSETKLDKEQRDLVDSINHGGQSVLTIINDVLDLSKLKNSKIKLYKKNVDLNKFVKNIHSMLIYSAQVKDINLTYETNLKNPNVFCDPVRLRQVIVNLLSNSIKFTERGEVKLIVNEISNDNNNSAYQFQVIDTGIGMQKDFIPKIFTPFEQDDLDKNAKGGTGLGMSITKRLIDLMGGMINIESEVSKGTSISIDLNLEIAEATQTITEVPLSTKNDLNNLKILYADDNSMNQKVVLKLLNSTNWQITCVENGQLALEEATSNKDYDVILMDIQMPTMNGLMATEKIREYEKINNLQTKPILAFSAFSFEEDRKKAIASGCNDLIGKPIRKKELISKIEEWALESQAFHNKKTG